MFRPLAIELRKLLPSRDFWVSLSAYAVLLPAVFLSLELFNFRLPGSDIGVNIFEFPDVWHNLAYVGGWVNYLLYVIVLQTVTHEYQYRTIRQNIVDGLSPWQYLWGKVSLLVVFAVGSTLLVAACALIAGVTASAAAHRAQVTSGAGFVGLYAVQLLGYLGFALLVGTAVRRTGIAILIFTAYTLMFEPLLRTLVPWDAARYLPSRVLTRLVPNPFFGYVGMGGPAGPDTITIAIAIVYAVVFVALSGWIIARQDL